MPLPPWMRRKSAIAGGVVLLLISGYFASCKVLDPRLPVTEERVEASMAAAAAYLVAHTEDSGRFVYEVDGAGDPTGTTYNVLRHAGTIYSLSMYYRDHPSEELRDAIVRAARYLRERHVSPVRDMEGVSTVFSLPGEEVQGHRAAKLGGAGLGLVALIRARELDESVVDLETLREIANFILFMQQPDGSFRSKYSEVIHFRGDFDSLYYPGEAILALTELYRIDPDRRWLDAALLASRSLINRQRSMERLPNDHWLMIAISKLIDLHGDAVRPPVGREELLDHAIAIGDGMIREQRLVRWIPGLYGSFVPDGRTTPSSTRLEGLLAIYQVLPRDRPAARSRFRETIHYGIGYLLACQNQSGPNAGAFRAALRSTSVGTGWNYVRNDYVQHALSALVGWGRISERATL